MEEKRALLDAAVATCDGNCIMTILLFIRRTLDHGKAHLVLFLIEECLTQYGNETDLGVSHSVWE